MFSWDEFQKYETALCLYREADNTRDGIRAVAHVVANRASDALNRWPKTWAEVVLQYEQFSSMTAPGDQQIKRDRTPKPEGQDAAHFEQCYEIADLVYSGNDPDPTSGATHYFADYIPMPAWAANMTFTVQIGVHRFYK